MLDGLFVLSGVDGIVAAAGTIVTALGAVVGVALAFKLGPKAITWGLGKIKLGR